MAYWIDDHDPVISSSTSDQRNFYCDTTADIADLPGIDRFGVQQGDDTLSYHPVGPGSSCLCIGAGSLYILNSQDVWVEV